MAEDYIVANHDAKQWLNPGVIGSGHKFPSILDSQLMQAAITLLVCKINSSTLNKFKKGCPYYTDALLGSWSIGGACIIGDYSEEELSKTVVSEYEDISLKVLAMIFETGTAGTFEVLEELDSVDILWLRLIEKILELENSETIFEKNLIKAFGKKWKEGFYQRLSVDRN